MSDPITGIVRLIHIVTSVAWVGGALLWGMIIAPRIFQRGPPQIRAPFAQAVMPAITRYYQIVAGLALVSGILLVGMIWGWPSYTDAFQVPTYGPSLAIGASAGIAMAIVGFGIVSPTGKKLVALMSSMKGPPTPEQQAQLEATGKKLGIMSMLVLLFGTIAMIGMAWAVNAVR